MLLAALVAGAIALVSLPREEEPQISVPMVDIFVQANGYKADQAVELVTRPLEDIIKGIDSVEHVYSQTNDDSVLVTARFLVGTDQDVATLRVHEKIRANIGDLPKGIPEPLIVGRGINDVAIVDARRSPQRRAGGPVVRQRPLPGRGGAAARTGQGRQRRRDLHRRRQPEPDPRRARPGTPSVYGITLHQLTDKLANANRSFLVGAFRDEGKSLPVLAGQTLQGVPDIGLLLLTTRDGRPVYVKDVADVVVGAAEPEHRAWTMTRGANGELQRRPAVTLAVAKRKGANAVTVAEDVMKRLEIVKGRVVPAGLEVTVTRNYGETATEKANELLFHLELATISIVVLITLAIGWREGLVVLIVIPTTILLTLFASWLMGYTINRVSLFALIFSIGILVDDAIVVVENIARHWAMRDGRKPADAAIEAVAEVGNPTIVATLTIVAALLPMMFVSGLMGPYMSPIPANASIAMLFSFFVAVTVTPWLLLRFAGRKAAGERRRRRPSRHRRDGPFLRGRRPSAAEGPMALEGLPDRRRARHRRPPARSSAPKTCAVKLLPFDNKSEIQVVLDLPHGSTLEDTDRLLMAAAERLKDLPELISIQAYAGTAAPFNFNGLVRHYYLRAKPGAGRPLDQPPTTRRSASRRAMRSRSTFAAGSRTCPLPRGFGAQGRRSPAGTAGAFDAAGRGLWARRRRAGARSRRKSERPSSWSISSSTSTTATASRRTACASPSTRKRSNSMGSSEQAVYDTIGALVGGVKVGYSQRGEGLKPIDISVTLPKSERTLERTPAVDAAACRRHRPAGRQCRAWRRRHGQARTRVLSDLPPQRALRGDGQRRGGRAFRGARSTACSRLRTGSPAWTGAGRDAGDQVSRPAGRRRRSPRCCGTASGRSPM